MATRTWYDSECVPFARSVVGTIRDTGKSGPKYELLEELAHMVETFTVGEGNDTRDNGLRDMLRNGQYAAGTNHVSNYKTQVMTKYMLLERVATTLGCAIGDKFVVCRSQSTDLIASRLQPVVRGSQLWAQDCNAIRNILATLDATPENPHPDPMPAMLNPQQEAHLRKIDLLVSAVRNHQLSAYHVAEGNLQYMAFLVQWHASRNIPFAKDSNSFFQELADSDASLGLSSLSNNRIAQLNDNQKQQVFVDLKACLDLAVHVSPLVLLHAVPGSRFNMERSSLVKWGLALGPKPDFIRGAEGKMWSMVIDVVLGMDAKTALQSFVHDSRDDINRLENNQEALGQFFINGRLPGNRTPAPQGAGIEGDSEMHDAPTAGIHTPHKTGTVDSHTAEGMAIDAPKDANQISKPFQGVQPVLDLDLAGLIAMPEYGLDTPIGDIDPSTAEDVLMPPHSPSSIGSGSIARHLLPAQDLLAEEDDMNRDAHAAAGRQPDGEEDSSESEDDLGVPDQPVKSRATASGRIVIPAQKFTAGASLTHVPPAKKRRLEHDEVEDRPSGQGRDSYTPKKSDIFWDVTTKFVKNAVLDMVPKLEPEAVELDDGDMAMSSPPPEQTPISQQTVTLKLFEEGKKEAAKDFIFQPDANSARFDIHLVQKIASMVEGRFQGDGRPPHHQPEASRKKFDGGSAIFTVDCKDFTAMDPAEIQAIHRHRHILVTGVDPGRRTQFDAEGLQKLRDIDAVVQIQYADRKTDNNAEGMLEAGKLRDLLDRSTSGSHVAMNCLDLPIGHASAPIPPLYTEIASDTYAVNIIKHLMKIHDMADVKSWATASTINACSWMHTDDLGLSTVIWVQAGGKWWVLARRIKDDPRWDEMSQTTTFEDWKVADIDGSLWELEAVYLKPDCVLYMRPCTPHFVLGIDNSIVLGRHYYATATIRRSCFGIVHTFVMGAGITNTSHDEDASSLWRQLMAMWYRHLILHNGFDSDAPHVPNMATEDGFLDVIALGCVLEFTTALTRIRYHPRYNPDTAEAEANYAEESQARTWFRVIMKIFATKYGTLVAGNIVHPSYILHRSLVGFAAAVVTHMKAQDGMLEPFEGGSASTVASKLRLHLKVDHPHLVAPFNAALKVQPPITSLSWDGGRIQIMPKTDEFDKLVQAVGIPEPLDLVERPLHPVGQSLTEIAALNKYFQGSWNGDNL